MLRKLKSLFIFYIINDLQLEDIQDLDGHQTLLVELPDGIRVRTLTMKRGVFTRHSSSVSSLICFARKNKNSPGCIIIKTMSSFDKQCLLL